MKFLLIEDNYDLAQAICARMQLDGHVIDHAGTIADAIAFSDSGEYDLILLDVMLPDGDGRDFLRRHRAGKGVTPIIVLTARSQVSDRISLLDLGADDYVTKPFDHAELEARCRAVLRRKAGTAQTVTRVGDVAFDPVAGVLTGWRNLGQFAQQRAAPARGSIQRTGPNFPQAKAGGSAVFI